MTVLDAEVIVAGGGPAGASAAAHLAARGVDVLVIEKATFPREKACAEFFSPGVIRELELLGVLGQVRKADAVWPSGIRITNGRANFLVSYPGDGPRTALGMQRPVLDQLLLTHAQEKGARLTHAFALGAVVEGGAVAGVRARAGGDECVLRSRFVVAADGLHSPIARSLGLQRSPRWPRRLGLVARYTGVRLGDGLAQMHVGRAAYCGIAPVAEGVVNVGLVVPPRAKGRGERAEAFFERMLLQVPSAAQVLADGQRVTPVRGNGPLARSVRRISGPGYLLAGDAAGFLDPFTGEGMHRALHGGRLAAQALARALEHGGAEPAGYANAHRRAFAAKHQLCLLVQGLLGSRYGLDYALRRLEARYAQTGRLRAALGDCGPAAPVLQPSYMWSLLKP